MQADVAEKLNRHKQSALRKFGYCEVWAADDDTLLVRRYFKDTDALGRKAPQKGGEEIIEIKR